MNDHIKRKWLRLKAVLGAGEIRQVAIAVGSGVDQATVSRVLARCPKRAGSAFLKLCKYAEKMDSASSIRDPAESSELMNAVGSVWDGSVEHAEALAVIIRAVGYATKLGKH